MEKRKKVGHILCFPHGSVGKESACNAGDLGLILGRGDILEKEMATHSSILVCKILWTEELGGLQPQGSRSQAWMSH